MACVLRGEVRWADLNPVRGREQAGRRPVLILSHDVFNEHSQQQRSDSVRRSDAFLPQLQQVVDGLNEIIGDR